MEQSEWGLMESWLWIGELYWELDDFWIGSCHFIIYIT